MLDLAAVSVLGNLEPSERSAFEAHVAQGCDDCNQELRMAGELAVGLATAVESEPPAGLRERLLAKLAPAPKAAGVLLSEHGLLIKRPEELHWKPFVPGIERKMLHTDTDRRYRSYLLRFEAGAKLFKHRHPEAEEILVISGDIHISGVDMKAGDYCRADADSVHEESWSEEGCVLFVVASMDNHVVE